MKAVRLKEKPILSKSKHSKEASLNHMSTCVRLPAAGSVLPPFVGKLTVLALVPRRDERVCTVCRVVHRVQKCTV